MKESIDKNISVSIYIYIHIIYKCIYSIHITLPGKGRSVKKKPDGEWALFCFEVKKVSWCYTGKLTKSYGFSKMLRILRSQTCLFHVFSCFFCFCQVKLTHAALLKMPSTWEVFKERNDNSLPWDSSLSELEEHDYSQRKGVHKTRPDKTDLTYSTHPSSIHFLQDYLVPWYARWWIQRLKQNISTSDFLFRKNPAFDHIVTTCFFSRGLNTTKIRPGQTRSILNLKMKQMDQSEIHSFNHQLLHLKFLASSMTAVTAKSVAFGWQAPRKRLRTAPEVHEVTRLEGWRVRASQGGGNDVP